VEKWAAMATTGAQRSKLVRIRAETQMKLRELADGQPVSWVIERLTDQEYRRLQMAAFNAAYARLKGDARRWAAYQDEQHELDGTVADGLLAEDGIEWEDSLADAAMW
jgi:hypothetical protein